MTLRVGLIVGREWSFPPAFIEEVNNRDEGVIAEFVQLGGTRMDDPCPYAVIIDRISHEVPYYRTFLKQAVLQGVTVVNNPFMWTADDKLFEAALATKLGIASPKTVALPNKDYVPGIVPTESLRNLIYPLDWQGIIDYVGLPCVLKDAHGGGWKNVHVCHSLEELFHHYDTSGLLTMILQEYIEWDHFVRCICLGQEEVLPIKYDPNERKYHVEHEHLSPELGRRIVDESLRLVRALGYDMNSMEWAIRDGVPYAIDFMNPAPDMDIYSLTPHYFEWAVKHMADMAIRLAKQPRPQARELRWDTFFAGRRQDVTNGPGGSPGGEERVAATAPPSPDPVAAALAQSTAPPAPPPDPGATLSPSAPTATEAAPASSGPAGATEAATLAAAAELTARPARRTRTSPAASTQPGQSRRTRQPKTPPASQAPQPPSAEPVAPAAAAPTGSVGMGPEASMGTAETADAATPADPATTPRTRRPKTPPS